MAIAEAEGLRQQLTDLRAGLAAAQAEAAAARADAVAAQKVCQQYICMSKSRSRTVPPMTCCTGISRRTWVRERGCIGHWTLCKGLHA